MVSRTASEVGVKQRDKMVVTLSMVWIGIMALLTVPKWVRDARDFVSGSTGHAPTDTSTKKVKGPQ